MINEENWIDVTPVSSGYHKIEYNPVTSQYRHKPFVVKIGDDGPLMAEVNKWIPGYPTQ